MSRTTAIYLQAYLPDSGAFGLFIGHLLGRLRLALGVWRERQRLTDLTVEELADVGISRGAARLEAERQFWDLPKNRS